MENAVEGFQLRVGEDHSLIGDLVSPEEIEAVLRPFSGRDLSPAEWQSIHDAEAEKLFRRKRKNIWLRWLPGGVRRQKSVKFSYGEQWAQFPAEQQVSVGDKHVPMEWGDRRFMGRAVGTKRVHLFLLMRIIETLRPTSILEVGAGNGLNLIELAAQFPGMPLCGLELTLEGVKAAKRLAQESPLPHSVLSFSPLPPVTNNVDGAIDFRKGDAARMSFPDGAYDLVYTSLALEQMEEVRESALREIARVSKRWVVLIEPFKDYNNIGLRGLYADANRYFTGRITELERFGLEPIKVFEDIPHKMTLRVVIVLARKK